MADADVQITAGSGTKVDTRTVGAGTDEHRQVVALGDEINAVDVLRLIPHDSADAGAPLKIGGIASSSAPTAVTTGDRTNAWFSLNGAQMTSPVAGEGNGADGATGGLWSARGGGTQASPMPAANYLYNGSTWDRVRGDTTGGMWVQGALAHDAVDSGNPVKIGGYASSAAPTAVATGDRVNAWYDTRGAQQVVVRDSSGTAILASVTPSDALANPSTLQAVVYNLLRGGSSTWERSVSVNAISDGAAATGITAAGLMGYNGTTWDRVRVANTGRLQVDVGTINGNSVQSINPTTDTNSTSTSLMTAAYNLVHNGTAWDRSRSVTVGDGAAATGIPAAGLMGYNGTNWDRIRVANTGRLQVDVVTGGGGGTQYVGDAAATATPTGTVAMGLANDTAPTQVSAANDAVAAWMDRRGALFTRLTDSAGAAIATGVQYVEDTALTANAGQGTLVVARRDDALSALTPVEGDAVGLRVNANGALWTVHDGAVDTELPAAAALADDTSNPTAPSVGAMPHAFDGTNWDRARAIAGLTAAVAENTREVGVPAAGIGPGFMRRVSGTIAANATDQILDAGGVGSVFVDITGTWVGTLRFEYSMDGGTTWVTAQDMLTISTSKDTWVGISGTTTANGRFRQMYTAGMTHFRVLSTAWTSGTATVSLNGETAPVGIKGIRVGPAPHEYGYDETAVSATFTAAQTSTTVGPTVSASQRLVVTYIQIQSYGTTAGTCVLYFGTGAYSRGTNKALFDGEFAPSATSKPGFAQSKPNGWIGAADEELKITTTNAQSVTVTVWYYLVSV